MYCYFSKRNTFNVYRFGFRKKHCAVMALMEVTAEVLEGFDRGDAVAATYLVLQKTFETIDQLISQQKNV